MSAEHFTMKERVTEHWKSAACPNSRFMNNINTWEGSKTKNTNGMWSGMAGLQHVFGNILPPTILNAEIWEYIYYLYCTVQLNLIVPVRKVLVAWFKRIKSSLIQWTKSEQKLSREAGIREKIIVWKALRITGNLRCVRKSFTGIKLQLYWKCLVQ